VPKPEKWSCHQTGDCCRAISAIRMSTQEAELLKDRADRVTLRWTPTDDPGFVELQAQPCPFLEGNSCSVYDIRPYNCRRWGCFRPDPQSEPLEPDLGFLGCANARVRFYRDRAVRRQLQHMERDAQRWALRHGWTGQER